MSVFGPCGRGCYLFVYVIEGPGLVFVVYPEVLGKLPLSSMWSAFFFLALVNLNIDGMVRSNNILKFINFISKYSLCSSKVLVI